MTGEPSSDGGARGRGRTTLRRATAWASFAIAALVLWLLLAGTPSVSELVVGAVFAPVAATAGYLVAVEQRVRFEPRRTDLLPLRSLPVAMFVESWAVLALLARQIVTGEKAKSLLLRAPFEHGDPDDPRASARRALAAAYASATPRVIVVDFDPQQDEILYHLLEPGPVHDALRILGERR